MKQKKNKGLLITIIIFLIIVILLIGTIAYLYFFTDMFKSNKQLFFKYMLQMGQSENGFVDNQIIEYFNKKKNTCYENNGEISFDISVPNLEEDLKLANKFNISFSGKIDSNNSKIEREISLNYSDDVKFPLTYRQTNNLVGLQTKYVGSSFVAIRNDQELKGNDEINKLAELQNIQISSDEIKNLKSKYFDTFINNLDDTKFTKVIEGNLTGYKLTLTGEETKNLLVQMLNTLKTDEETLEKINTMLNLSNNFSKLDSNKIEKCIENINNDFEISENIEIILYANNGNLNKITAKIEENEITISKNEDGEQINYIIEYSSTENPTISINIKFSGLNSQNVTENYEIQLQEKDDEENSDETEETSDKSSYKYLITNNVQFKDNVNIEELSEENAVILNDKDEEYVNNLMKVIAERLKQVNKVQMEDLGVTEEENPIKNLLPTMVLSSKVNTQLNEIEVNTFNAKFELYESTNTKGATVKGLLTTIQNSNETETENKIKEINMDGEEYEVTEQNITFLKSSINVDDSYKVEFEKDIDTGLIYRAVINKK